MLEKRFYAVPPQAFTADGTTNGSIAIAGEACHLFKVKMKVFINATGLPTLALEVKEIDSANNIQVGPIPGPGVPASITSRTDISAYTVLLGANISADEQKRPSIDYAEIMRAVYDEEPAVALRNVLVDECGNRIGSVTDSHGTNRLAVDGQFTAEVDVQVDVDVEGVYDPTTNPNPDSIGLIGHLRSNPTDKTDQTQRITAKRGTLDTDTVSQDVSLHDDQGNAYTHVNPLPVSTSYEKFFTLISEAPWLKLGNYTQVTPTVIGSDLLFSFIEEGAVIGEALISNYASEIGWTLTLSAFIDDDDGSKLQDDNGTFLNLD